MLGLLERIAGVGFLDDLSEFLSAIDGLSQGFQDRATRVEEVLLGDGTGFVLISTGNQGSSESTLEFMSELDEFRVPLIAVILNRMHPWPLAYSPGDLLERCRGDALERDEDRLMTAFRAQATPTTPAPNFHRVSESVLEIAAVCETEKRTVDRLIAGLKSSHLECLTLPELPGELDRIEGLLEIGSILRGDSPPSPVEGST
jgi:anion-transporting  ArsA/GET3 family ATPase